MKIKRKKVRGNLMKLLNEMDDDMIYYLYIYITEYFMT